MRKTLLALVAAAGVALGLPATAHAGPAPVPYLFCTPAWNCVVVPQPPLVSPICIPCAEAIDLHVDVSPQAGQQFYATLRQAMQDFGAGQPNQGEAVLDNGVQQFLRGMQLPAPTVGFVDPDGTFQPSPLTWRQQAGADITDAVQSLIDYWFRIHHPEWWGVVMNQVIGDLQNANAIYEQHALSA
jgi:hypothetical protein